MKKLTLICTALLLVGCDSEIKVQKHTWAFQEICVDGVVYLRTSSGGITPKVNADFYPYTCNKQSTNP